MHSSIRDRRGGPWRTTWTASARAVVLGGFGVLAALAISCRTARAQDSTSCVVSPASEASSAADTTGRGVGPLHTGDLLKINVFRQKELTGDYLIDNQGRVVIPGLGAIAAAGSVPAAVERRIKALLACRGYQPDVSVQAQIRVSVLGEVRTPGLLTVEPGVKVLQIITLAGGQTPDADLARTRILREGRSYTIDLNTALAGTSNGETGGIVLQSGDVVLVPKRSGFSREDWAFVFSGLATLMTVVNVVVTLSRR